MIQRKPRLVAAVGLAVMLTSCAAPVPTHTPQPDPTPTPTPEVAPLGSSALPLGCADLVDPSSLASMAPPSEPAVVAVVDERRIEQDMRSVAERQAGVLRCAWSNNYGGTDFSRHVRLTVAPTTASSLDPSAEPINSVNGWAEIAGDDPTLGDCSAGSDSGSGELFGSCVIIQLRDGYRIDLTVVGMPAATVDEALSFSQALLNFAGAAIGGAPPAREIATAAGTTDPASYCNAPAVLAVAAARGATGDPKITSEIPGVTTCSWHAPDPYGYSGDYTFDLNVIPGGAWAFQPLSEGVGRYPLWYEPSAFGPQLIGTGDWLAAFLVVDDDLLQLSTPYGPEDPDAWAQLLAAQF